MKKLIAKLKSFLTKELILYIAFGVGTTLVNIAAFHILNDVAGINYLVANIIAWVLAVTFAYLTNKFFVFKTRGKREWALVVEASEFFLARLASLGVDELGMYLLVDVAHWGEMVAKLVMNVVVIIINYALSKLVIFKKENK